MPALNKLAEKFGEKDLVIIGISLNEERAVVEKFLDKHPHSFPTVLTTENDLPARIALTLLPTYIVIGKDGTLTSAADAQRGGLVEVYRLLKKGGLEGE